ncbi:hypothetical protein D3C80_1954400 [compost metagenome]
MLATLGGAVAGQQARGHADGGTDQGIAAGAVLLLGRVAVRITLHIGAAGGAGRQDGRAHQGQCDVAGGVADHGVLLGFRSGRRLAGGNEDKQPDAMSA